MVKVKIIDIRDIPSADAARMGSMDKVITYQVDPTRTYIVRMPAEEWSQKRMVGVIAADMKERKKWQGKELEIPED